MSGRFVVFPSPEQERRRLIWDDVDHDDSTMDEDDERRSRFIEDYFEWNPYEYGYEVRREFWPASGFVEHANAQYVEESFGDFLYTKLACGMYGGGCYLKDVRFASVEDIEAMSEMFDGLRDYPLLDEYAYDSLCWQDVEAQLDELQADHEDDPWYDAEYMRSHVEWTDEDECSVYLYNVDALLAYMKDLYDRKGA